MRNNSLYAVYFRSATFKLQYFSNLRNVLTLNTQLELSEYCDHKSGVDSRIIQCLADSRGSPVE